MWKILKFLIWTLRMLVWLTVALAVAVLVALYILERGIPEPLVRRLAESCSTQDYLCRIERATFSLEGGFRFHRVKIFPKRVADRALVSVDEIAVDVSLNPTLKHSDRLRHVTLKNVRFPALPPKAAAPEHTGTPPAGRAPDLGKGNGPSMAPFALTLDNADILGLQAARVTAQVSVQPPGLSVTQVVVHWPDKAVPMSLSGCVTVDYATRMVTGSVKGQTFPANVLPLLTSLRARGAIKQIACFSKIARPVDADAQFGVNIDNSDFSLRLGLVVGDCAYRGVPMRSVKGTLCAYGTNVHTTVDVVSIEAESATGPLSGRLVYREDNESLDLDASCAMDLTQLVTVLNVLNDGQLKPIRCDTPPRITARGLLALNSRTSTVTNSLTGKIAFDTGSIFDLRVRDVTSDLTINGYTALFDPVAATSASGGKIHGDIMFAFPNYSATSTLFTAHANLSGLDLSDLYPLFHVTNSRVGTVSGRLLLNGHASNRTIPSLSGEGQMSIQDGLLHRLPLFAGFTDYLASNIPGVSSLVNQSSGSMDFRISDGVLRTDNLLVEGSLFSLQGRGTCDLDTEKLDLAVRANIFKEKTFAGRITRLVTLPFTRLLLEFKVFGTLDNTDWAYVNIIERITDGLSDISDTLMPAPPAPAPPPKQTP